MGINSTPLDAFARHRLVPVIALDSEDHAEPLAEALLAGGLPIAEVTFRTDAAAAAIRRMADRDDMLVGAGTVLSATQVEEAYNAGAKFIISPGFSEKVVVRALDLGLTVCPGICTPTEIQQAMEFGLDVVKFFPAEAFGGLSTLKALAAPFRKLKFIPTGGISPGNVNEYLALDSVLACGGSWMVKPSLFSDGDFGSVTRCVQEAMQLIRS